MKHTVNIAAGLTIIIQDDQGHPIQQLIFPFALLFFSLPACLYTWLQVSVPAICHLLSAILHASRLSSVLSPTVWQHDLILIYWAVRLFIHQRRFAYA